MTHYNNTTVMINGIQYTGLYSDKNSLQKVSPGKQVFFCREPENPKDENAVSVYLSEGEIRLGYVPRKQAAILAPILDRGSNYHCVIKAKYGNLNKPLISTTLTTYPIKRSPKPSSSASRTIGNSQSYNTPTGKQFRKITNLRKWSKAHGDLSGVYIIWNRQGKGYIGQSGNIGQRWLNHWHALNARRHGNQILQRDWVQIGPDEFRFDMIDERNEHLDEAEAFYIDSFNTFHNGYNRTPDGQKILGYVPPVRPVNIQEPLNTGVIIPIHPQLIEKPEETNAKGRTKNPSGPINNTGNIQPPPSVHTPGFKPTTKVHGSLPPIELYPKDELSIWGGGNVINEKTPIKTGETIHQLINGRSGIKPLTQPEHPSPKPLLPGPLPLPIPEPMPVPKPILPDDPEKSWLGMWAFILFVIVLISAILSGNDAQDQGVIVYEIQSGDTLSKIAKKHGVDVNEVIEANEIVDKDLVEPGMTIVIPTGK